MDKVFVVYRGNRKNSEPEDNGNEVVLVYNLIKLTSAVFLVGDDDEWLSDEDSIKNLVLYSFQVDNLGADPSHWIEDAEILWEFGVTDDGTTLEVISSNV